MRSQHELLQPAEEVKVVTENAQVAYKWLQAVHKTATRVEPTFSNQELPGSLELGGLSIQDNLLDSIRSDLLYHPDSFEYELSTYLMIPDILGFERPSSPYKDPLIDLRKIASILREKLAESNFAVSYDDSDKSVKLHPADQEIDDEKQFTFDNPNSPFPEVTLYRVYVINSAEQPSEEFEKVYQTYGLVLKNVIDAIYAERYLEPFNKTYTISPPKNTAIRIKQFESALKMHQRNLRAMGVLGDEVIDDETVGKIKPENMKNILFDDIGGHEEAKKLLRLGILGMTQPEKFTEQGAIPPTKFLLNGPTGTGKTSLAIATARETGFPTYSMQIGNILRSLVGASEQRVRDTFAQARRDGKAVIILDELDAISRSRDGFMHGITTTLMTELDGIENNTNILVIGTTNLREIIDPGMLRAGRFNHIIDVKLPEEKDLERIFTIYINTAEKRAQRRLFDNLDLAILAKRTKGLSGADIEEIVKRVVNQRVMEKQFLGIEPPEFETTNRILQKIEQYDPVRKGKGITGFTTSHSVKPIKTAYN